MKPLLLVAVLLALWIPQNLTAQEPTFDPGEQNVLVQACQVTTDIATAEGFTVKNCRRAKPDVIMGNKAVIQVRIATQQGPLFLAVTLFKSPWGVSSLVVNG